MDAKVTPFLVQVQVEVIPFYFFVQADLKQLPILYKGRKNKAVIIIFTYRLICYLQNMRLEWQDG